MKQTVEEAAHSFAESRSSGSAFPAYYQGFIAGAEWQKDISSTEWQAKQSPWISVKERLPEEDGYYFVTDGDIVEKVYFYKVWNKFVSTKEYPHLFFNEGVIKAWLFIPSFDEIL